MLYNVRGGNDGGIDEKETVFLRQSLLAYPPKWEDRLSSSLLGIRTSWNFNRSGGDMLVRLQPQRDFSVST
jgi:hypothetical protein